ncbi:MAG TPA: SIMPL domain-containing protein [Sphingomonadaceae bacterium]|nr:SIMPL domain-containing protein [Sphingomonadaceae bacterium]
MSAGLILAAAALAQVAPLPVLQGTRLDVVATGEVTRVPDLARISAGVVSQAPTAVAALTANSAQMTRVLAALRRAGIAERDIQTSSVNLSPTYRYADNQPPVLTGYGASNQVTIRFREIARAGAILDTLVREGANQIAGPSLEVERPGPALDEARVLAVRAARARADIYARAAGLSVARILSITENGGDYRPPPPQPVAMMQRGMADMETKIVPGEQALAVSVSVSFELR